MEHDRSEASSEPSRDEVLTAVVSLHAAEHGCHVAVAESVTSGDAGAAVAVTGVGGPDAQEGRPPRTIFLATRHDGEVRVPRHRFPGAPHKVVAATVTAALAQLVGT